MGSVDLPEMVQAGIDTVSFYLCLEGSPAIEKIARLPGKAVAYQGTMLGEHASWGAWAHTFGYRAIWRPERKRLYLFPKLAAPNELCPRLVSSRAGCSGRSKSWRRLGWSRT